MIIDDMGELSEFETPPTEATFYLTMVRYESCNGWITGPSGLNKESVLVALEAWQGLDAARIYTIRLPMREIHEG